MPTEAIGAVSTAKTGTTGYSLVSPSNVSTSAPDAISTDLPQPQAVGAATKSDALPVDNAKQAEDRAALVQKIRPNFIKTAIVSDDSSNEIVFLKVDDRTGEVIDKFPNTVILRKDAYQQADALKRADATITERVA